MKPHAVKKSLLGVAAPEISRSRPRTVQPRYRLPPAWVCKERKEIRENSCDPPGSGQVRLESEKTPGCCRARKHLTAHLMCAEVRPGAEAFLAEA